jgi:CO/xanthine dehydrogenase FAD-binding subunit
MQDLQYLRPKTLEEALDLLDKYGKEAKILAGGTDIIIALKDKAIICKYIIDIKGIKDMQSITYSEEDGLSIGASVSLNEIIESKEIKSSYNILMQAAHTLANSLLRNRATLIGNICNSSPGGDMLPASLVLNGEIQVVSKDQSRIIPLKEFFIGVKRNVLKDNEIVTKIIFPPVTGQGRFLKKSRIKGHDLAQISVAAFLKEDGNLKISIGAAAPTPILVGDFRNYKGSELLKSKNEIVDKVMSSINPINDVRATKDYRLAMVRYFTGEIIEELGGDF